MDKQNLVKLLNNILASSGFSKKGNNWTLDNGDLCKKVTLQKSNYGNQYYVNYGYIVNGLQLTTTEHVSFRLGAISKTEQTYITDLLDLTTDIIPDVRLYELEKYVIRDVVLSMQLINNEQDLLAFILSRPTLNNIPLVVKEHFKIGDL